MRIYMIASTSLNEGVEKFLKDKELTWTHTDTPSNAERVVEFAGRVCYMSFGALQHRKSSSEYLKNIISQRHDSVLEHASFTLLVDGVSRALTHQIVRHRAGFSYSQLSQQYHDESDVSFVLPDSVESDPVLRQRWEHWRNVTMDLYSALKESSDEVKKDLGVATKEKLRLSRSVARSVLPNATESTLVVTGNARAWRDMLKKRGEIRGDIQMREYCVAVFCLLVGVSPLLFEGFEVAADELGSYLKFMDTD